MRINVLGFVLSLFFFIHSNATTIQILHTNDLHAAFHTYGAPEEGNPEWGGWAQVKTVMDQLTDQASQKGIETVRIDAGDYSDGTMEFFPNNGLNVLQALVLMRYDYLALGNHDFFQGAKGLNELYGKVGFSGFDKALGIKTPVVLVGNVNLRPQLHHLYSQMMTAETIKNYRIGAEPYARVYDGIKVCFAGFTTTDANYRWMPKIDSKRRDMIIENVIPSAKKVVKELKRRGCDAIIASTHLGESEDKKLIEEVDGIDFIVGGHSHHAIYPWIIAKNKKTGRESAIVQAGFNGHFVGKVQLKFDAHKRIDLAASTYELVEVLNSTPLNQDPYTQKLVSLIERSDDELRKMYPGIDDIIIANNGKPAESKVRVTCGPSAFGKFVVQSFAHATRDDADVAIDVGNLQGDTFRAAGPLTSRNIMDMYPRRFGVDRNEGWRLYRAKVPGWFLKLVLKLAVSQGIEIAITGMSFDAVPSLIDTDQMFARNIRLTKNNEKIKNLKIYTVAAPEGLIRGAYGITEITRLLISGGKPIPGKSIFSAMLDYMKVVGTIEPLDDSKPFTGAQFKKRLDLEDRAVQEKLNFIIKEASRKAESGDFSFLGED